MKIRYVITFLVLLCCLMGFVSATEDVSSDDVITLNDMDQNISVNIQNDEKTNFKYEEVSEDINMESSYKNQNDLSYSNSDEILSTTHVDYWGSEVEAEDWEGIYTYSIGDNGFDDYVITLTGTEYEIGESIDFATCITIIGSEESYITGTSSEIVFTNTNDCVINFINVTFKNIESNTFIKLFSSYKNTFENCTFINISTSNDDNHCSVIWNYGGLMNITNCKFINCTNGFGVITNHINTTLPVDMIVDNCNFVNNYARVEPGAINNCGNLTVTNSNFTNNSASWWAGAIHTHYNAKTIIALCNFTNNFAGWNGGALYTYSKLEIYNSNFINNSCNKTAGGGAIGSFGNSYDIYVYECHFENNSNIANLTTEIPSVSNGGAISALNGGYLEVVGSTFINNYAKNGQAISAYGAVYPNMTYGLPNVRIAYNTFTNHKDNNSDTVALEGTYIFEDNTLINCNQINRIENNSYINCTPNNELNAKVYKDNLLTSTPSDEILGDNNYHDVIYVNMSREGDNNYNRNESIDGQSWENPYVGLFGLNLAKTRMNNNGIIYLTGFYGASANIGLQSLNNNVTFIGETRDTCISDNIFTIGPGTTDKAYNNTHTIINMTFDINKTQNSRSGIVLVANVVFINCTFIDSPISNNNQYKKFNVTFYDCIFANYTKLNYNNISSLLYSNAVDDSAKFYDCLFENITYDCVLLSKASFSNFSIYNSTFKNCNVNGIVGQSGDIDDVMNSCFIEDCNYDFPVTTGFISINDESEHYSNATKLKVVSVDSHLDINSTEHGTVVVCLTDVDGVPIAGANVKYVVNGGDEQIGSTDESGRVVIPGLSGEVFVNVTYDGNESYNSVNGSNSFNFTSESITNSTNSTNSTTNSTNSSSTTSKPTTISTTSKNSKTVITKSKVKITSSSKTFKIKAKTKKLTAKLTNNKGKVLKNTKLVLKIAKKTYSAKTNSKGIATFKVKLTKKGKYTGTITFSGNSLYKSLSKNVKVTVKK